MAYNRTLKEIKKEIECMTPEEAINYLNTIKPDCTVSLEKLIASLEKEKLAHEKEIERLHQMSSYERGAREKGYRYIAGIDEAGRGPLAGPVVAACVMLPENCMIEGINDSKKLSAAQREKLYEIIVEKAISIGIGIVNEKRNKYTERYQACNEASH